MDHSVYEDSPVQTQSDGASGSRCLGRLGGRGSPAVSALMTGMFYGLSPLSIGFWDPDSGFYWRELYVVGQAGRTFRGVLPQIPQSGRESPRPISSIPGSPTLNAPTITATILGPSTTISRAFPRTPITS